MAGAQTKSGFLRYRTPICVAANGKTIATFCDENYAEEWVDMRAESHPDITYSIFDLREPKRAAKIVRREG